MPDVNLLRNTERPDEQAAKQKAPPMPELSRPTIEPKRSLGESLRAMLGRRNPEPVAPAAARPSGMTLERGASGQRILTDKTQTASNIVVPLPEDDDFNVNLLTEDVVGTFNVRLRLMQLGGVALGAIVLVALAYVGLSYYENSVAKEVAKIQAETASTQKEITSLQSDLDQAKTDGSRLTAARTLIDEHIRWSKFFEKLERYTLPQVTYGGSFSGTLTNEMTFSAKTDSFESLAQQYLVFQEAINKKDFISGFSITGATRTVQDTKESVVFNVSMQLVPTVFTIPAPSTTTE